MSGAVNNTTDVPRVDVEEDEASFIVVAVILMVYSIVGTVGNAIAFYIFFHRRDKSTSVIFILALAGCDFFTCLVIIPYTIAFEMLQSVVEFDVFCKLFMFLQTSNIPFSACIMVAIAFDRYFCICHPFLHAFTVSRAKITVVCLALMTVTFGILTSLSFGVYRLEYRNITGYANTTENFTDTQIINYASLGPVGNDSGMYISQNLDNPYENLTYDNIMSYEQIRVVHTGICVHNQLIVSTEFMIGYQKVYTAVYIISFVSVAVLYTLIYKSILLRRAKKAKRKKMSHYHSVAGAEGTIAETQMSTINGTAATKVEPNNQNPAPSVNKGSVKRQSTLRDTNFYANIKTAAMLFVVTLVFIIAFLPSWLMAHSILPLNLVVFYMYFTYNVVNPVIYAFMNQTFRDDLKKLINVCK